MVHSLDLGTLSAALDSIDEAIGIYDADDRLVGYNQHYAAWRHAIGGDVTRGACWRDLVEASVKCGAIPEAIGREEQWLEYRRGTRGSYSIVRELADGRAFKVNERRMADGGVAVVWTDITDLLTAQRERTEAIAREEQALRAMGQLTANVAHDFNNLLTAVMGNLALLREHVPAMDTRGLRLIDNALQGAERGAALTQRLLAFSRQESAPESQAVDVAWLLGGMSALLRSAVGASVRVEMDIPPALPSAHVDRAQLEMALLNLVINARDAMKGVGTILIAAREERAIPHDGGHAVDAPRGDYVVIGVKDHGVGMDADTRARAVQPFFTTKREGHGTGLGLSMVNDLATRSGGKLVIDSEPGKGTTIEVWLPQPIDGD